MSKKNKLIESFEIRSRLILILALLNIAEKRHKWRRITIFSKSAVAVFARSNWQQKKVLTKEYKTSNGKIVLPNQQT